MNQTAEEDRNLAERLKTYKESLGREGLRPGCPDQTVKGVPGGAVTAGGPGKKFPMLQREDIEREGGRFSYEVKMEDGVNVIHSNLFTSGIGYLKGAV